MRQGVLGTVGTVAAFGAGQAKKAKTAWGEYEAGYKGLGGDVADIPERGGFFKQLGQTLMPGGDKGFFQMPEGEVEIGDKMYDRSKIQKAGAFLGSDPAIGLFYGDKGDNIRDQYLKRTAPGRDITQPPATQPTDTSSVSAGVIPQEQLAQLTTSQSQDNEQITENPYNTLQQVYEDQPNQEENTQKSWWETGYEYEPMDW